MSMSYSISQYSQSVGGYCQYFKVDKPPAYIEILGTDLILYWRYVGVDLDSIEFTIESIKASYLGIGFGKTMINTDMIVIRKSTYIDRENIPPVEILEIFDMYSKGNVAPDEDERLGGTNDVKMLGYQFTDSGKMRVVFERKL